MQRLLSVLANGLLCTSLLLMFGRCVASAAAPESCLLTVVDSATHAPVADASVFILGSSQDAHYTARTDAKGQVQITSLSAGAYRFVIEASGYEKYVTRADVRSDAQLVLTVALHPMKIIASTIVSAPRSTVTREYVSEHSDQMKISRNLAEAIDSLSGTQVVFGTDGQASGIALDGKDSSLTSYALNGSPVDSDLGLQLLNSGLVDAARVDQNSESVGFTALQPMITPQYGGVLNLGGWGYGNGRLTVQSTSGQTGFVLASSRHYARDALDGQTYLDTSGLSYQHSGRFSSAADLASVAVPLGGAWQITATGLTTVQHEQPIYTIQEGPLPYGIGPANYQDSVARDGIIAINGVAGATSIALSVSGGSVIVTTDDRNRVLNKVSEPMYATGTSSASDSALSVSWNDVRASYAVDASSQIIGDATHVSSTLPQEDGVFSGQTSFALVSMRRTVQDRNLTREFALSWGHAGGFSGRYGFDTNLQWHHLQTTVGASYSYQMRSPASQFNQSYSAPDTLAFNCSAISASGRGPDDAPSFPSGHRFSVTGGYGPEARHVSISFYSDHFSGETITGAIVPLSAERSGLIPSSYLAAVNAAFQTAGGCGTPAHPLNAGDVLFSQELSGIDARYRGVDVQATMAGRWISAQVFVNFNKAWLASTDPRLEVAGSPFIPGAQIPQVPFSRYGATVALTLAAETQLLMSDVHTSRNNAHHLPAYDLATIGFEHKISDAATIDVVATNLLHNYTEFFANPNIASPLATIGGRDLRLPGIPLQQPELFARLTFKLRRS